jgi:hypothetical protein
MVLETGDPIAQVAGDLGVRRGHPGQLGERRPAAPRRGHGALGEDERAELVRLHHHIFLILMYRRTSGSDLTTTAQARLRPLPW